MPILNTGPGAFDNDLAGHVEAPEAIAPLDKNVLWFKSIAIDLGVHLHEPECLAGL